jgi:hypothetical protein
VPSLAESRERRVQRLPAMARVAAAVAVVVTGGVLGFAIVDGIRSGTPNTTAASQAPREEKSLSTNDSGQRPTFAFAQRAYTKAGLANEVRALLAAGRAPASAQGAAPQVPRPGVAADKLAEGAALRPCVLAATGRPQVSPIAVDLGTYQGKPAAVVVLPNAKDPARVDVYVVDSTCTAGKGRVLESRQLPRP